jgi:mitochondrial fission protein ELM1
MFEKSQVVCWVVTTGVVGMENQCVGLAEALGLTPQIKRIALRTPWRQLAPFFRHGLAHAFSSLGDPVAPPWPDLLIASGRVGAIASIYARRAAAQAGRRTFTVQIQNPMIDPSYFDLLAVPRHDGLLGPNVVTTRGSMHRVTVETLHREALAFKELYKNLPHPRVAVVIGGSSAVYHMTEAETLRLVGQLRALMAETGAGLMITTSRRTGAANLKILTEGLSGLPCHIWDGTGPNPYFGMLGLAEAILVTADSTNLVSEACSTGKPVHVIDLPGGSEKFRRFHQTLRDDGLTRPFTGTLDEWDYQPLNDVHLVAARVLELMSR